jgi:molybdate transport system permease protein
MDWQTISLSLKLATATLIVLLPLAIGVGYGLAITRWRAKPWIEGLLALPLVLPPTVIGFYLMIAMGGQSWLGQWYERLAGSTLAFSFNGLVVASVIFNIPFAVQPIQRAFEGIAPDIREAAQCCGLTFRQAFTLMVGGNIPGETKTVAIAIYDRAQAFDLAAAGSMSLLLLAISLVTIAVSYGYVERLMRRRRA